MRAVCPFLALIAVCAPASAGNVDYARSEISFVSKQMNVPVEGRFRKFSALIVFDSGKLGSSKAEIDVDLASIDTGSTEADDEVGTKTWFNTSAFPTAKFSSSKVTKTGPDRYEVRGKLSIKGISNDVAAPFVVRHSGDAVTYEGNFTLKRLQFRIGEGVWSDTETVADEVQVKFRIVAKADK
jgi:polyisoprenoid-binding protein YceI